MLAVIGDPIGHIGHAKDGDHPTSMGIVQLREGRGNAQ